MGLQGAAWGDQHACMVEIKIINININNIIIINIIIIIIIRLKRASVSAKPGSKVGTGRGREAWGNASNGQPKHQEQQRRTAPARIPRRPYRWGSGTSTVTGTGGAMGRRW